MVYEGPEFVKISEENHKIQMKRFSELIAQLDQTNKTGDKLILLQGYFKEAPDQDRLWTLAVFTHKRPKRTVTTRQLRKWCCEIAGIPDWLFEESYQTVGDLAETIALVLPENREQSERALHEWIQFLESLKIQDETGKKREIVKAWNQLKRDERLVFNKLITGGFRIGVSQQLITRALAATFDMEKSSVAHRIMGNWNPFETTFRNLLFESDLSADRSRPYPFYLAHPLEETEALTGTRSDWLAEWKWDGIRGQLIQRKGEVFIWSRGEELVTGKFPELEQMGKLLPEGTVLDGEIMPFEKGSPLPFGVLQTRLGRKTVSTRLLREAPVTFMAYDLLEWKGKDVRHWELWKRRETLKELVRSLAADKLKLSRELSETDWTELAALREQSRSVKAEGLMLKRKNGVYETGRKRGGWWKWKIDPLTVDGVMIYAQKGHGRRANLYSDYTFGVWNSGVLIPFAKAYSGLTDQEMKDVDSYVKKNTRERFGPVRTVKPGLVFEIAFEGIQESPRHKSGIALRFPRIHRWRKDKTIESANTLDDLKDLLEKYGK